MIFAGGTMEDSKIDFKKFLIICRNIMVITWLIGLIIVSLTLRQGYLEQKNQKEQYLELLVFSEEIINYCAKLNNQTFEELLDNYEDHKIKEITGEFYNEK